MWNKDDCALHQQVTPNGQQQQPHHKRTVVLYDQQQPPHLVYFVVVLPSENLQNCLPSALDCIAYEHHPSHNQTQ